jgi:hypothetical protein
LKDIDHDLDQAFDMNWYLSTAPVFVTPSEGVDRGKPASATYIAPLPSKAMPRGFAKLLTTMLKVHVGDAAAALALVTTNDPISAKAPVSNTRRKRCIQVPPDAKGHASSTLGASDATPSNALRAPAVWVSLAPVD